MSFISYGRVFCKHSLILLTAAADKVGIPLFLSSMEEAQRFRRALSLVGVQTSCQMHTPAPKPGDVPRHLHEVGTDGARSLQHVTEGLSTKSPQKE